MDFEKTVSEKETDVIIKLQAEIDGLKEKLEEEYNRGFKEGLNQAAKIVESL